MHYLLAQGYRCIPVRNDGTEVLGIPSVPSLHAREAVAVGAKGIWLQLGIVSAEARAVAEAAGVAYVENACTAVVHARGLRN